MKPLFTMRGHGFTAESMRERFASLQPEFELYVREAPKARKDDPSKRSCVMKGKSFTAWPTSKESFEYGYATFGNEPFLVQALTDENYEAVLMIFPEFRRLAPTGEAGCTSSTTASVPMDASSASALV
jgi:hypothetical protein